MSMIRDFRLPDLGEGLTESEIVAWHVAVGDTVELNQIIAEVETAKASSNCPRRTPAWSRRCTQPGGPWTSASRSSRSTR